MLPGSPFGNVDAFAPEDDLLVYRRGRGGRCVHRGADAAPPAPRRLVRPRRPGPGGRTSAPESPDYTQIDALERRARRSSPPALYDLDLGHVPRSWPW